MIKCVIWDLDNTLLDGVYLEAAGEPPPADPDMLAVLGSLSSRGIIHAVASRNPQEAAEHAAAATGHQFAAVACGWGRKSDAIRQIIDDLGLSADAAAFVDDEAYERAEVSFAMPELMVLSPEDMADAPGWPEFGPATVTPEGRRRGEMYAQRRIRQREAAAFGGSREEFLRQSGTSIVIGPAGPEDLPRLHELSVRTHQFNSAGRPVSEAELRTLADAPDRRVMTVTLSDSFGDDGLIGGCVIETGKDGWTVPLLMMSCRAIGRGVIDVLLAWLTRTAARNGAASLTVPCLLSDRNVPLRLALAGAGLRAIGVRGADNDPGGQAALFGRQLHGTESAGAAAAEPSVPAWVTAPEL